MRNKYNDLVHQRTQETYLLKKEIENLEKEKKELQEKNQSLQEKIEETTKTHECNFLSALCRVVRYLRGLIFILILQTNLPSMQS